MKNNISRISLVFVIVLFGCLSSGARPKWIDSIPSDNNYYIGIGASNIGDKAKDYEAALQKAKANLVSDISLHIEATTTVVANSDIKEEGGKSKQVDTLQMQESITQYVEHHVKDIEIAGNWYSKKEGYWVYVRLNKSLYALNRQKEMDAIANRVYEILKNKTGVIAKDLEAYFGAYEIITNSNYANEVVGTIDGDRGILKDIVQSHIVKRLSSIKIEASASSKVLYGDGVTFLATVSSPLGSCDGLMVSLFEIENDAIPKSVSNEKAVILRAQVKNGEPLELFLQPKVLSSVGEHIFNFTIDLGEYASFYDTFAIKTQLPFSRSRISVSAPMLKFVLTSEDKTIKAKESSLIGALKNCGVVGDFVSSNYGYECDFQLSFEELPRFFENQPLYVKSILVITLTKDAKKLFAYNAKEIKGAGANQTIATQNCFKALIKDLSNDTTLKELWNNAFVE